MGLWFSTMALLSWRYLTSPPSSIFLLCYGARFLCTLMPPVLQEIPGSCQVVYLQRGTNKMEGVIGKLCKPKKQPLPHCLLRVWAGPFWEFLSTSEKPALPLIWLFDYSCQDKPFNSTFLRTGLFSALHCSVSFSRVFPLPAIRAGPLKELETSSSS